MNLILAKMTNLMFGASQLVREPVPPEKDLGDFNWIYDITDVINAVLWPLLIIVAAAGTIYAVVLGVNMARADSTEKREEAKKRVINVLVGMAIIVGLVLLLKLFINQLPNWIPAPETQA